MQLLSAARYTSLSDRGRYASLPAVRQELDCVIKATPTQLQPRDRGEYLSAILSDLAQGSTWIAWPDDVLLLALTAVKFLGRNPVGSGEQLMDSRNLATIVMHSKILGGSQPSSPAGTKSTPTAQALEARMEALRILANTLVLHPFSRRKIAPLGIAEAIAHSLTDDIPSDRLFLYCRIAFLITADGTSVRDLVDKENIVQLLITHLTAIHPAPTNYDVLSEILKLTGNVLRVYSGDAWDPRMNGLLSPLLNLVHTLPLCDLIPPLTHALHALLSIPFNSDLLSTWNLAPATAQPSQVVSPPQDTKKAWMKKRSDKASESSRRGPSDANMVECGSLPTSSTLPPPPSGSFLHMDADGGSFGSSSSRPSSARTSPQPHRVHDPRAFPRRLLGLLRGFIDAKLPGRQEPDPALQLDDVLAPVLALAAHACTGSADMRSCFRGALFSLDLDRSPEAGPLESRPGLLGSLLRLLNSTVHLQCRDTAGEMFWAVCDGNASDLCEEIGYGNAAGLLFRKGISGPPSAKVTEIEDPPALPPKGQGQQRRAKELEPEQRHPITALDNRTDTGPSPFAGMSDEDKEREAEKMFVLFDRMSRNSMLSAGAPQADGSTKPFKDIMNDKMTGPEGEQWERREAQRQREAAVREEEEDEAQALREMSAYRSRNLPRSDDRTAE